MENLGVQELDAREMKSTDGGWCIYELIKAAWDATPDGWNSTWTPGSDYHWNGYYWQF